MGLNTQKMNTNCCSHEANQAYGWSMESFFPDPKKLVSYWLLTINKKNHMWVIGLHLYFFLKPISPLYKYSSLLEISLLTYTVCYSSLKHPEIDLIYLLSLECLEVLAVDCRNIGILASYGYVPFALIWYIFLGKQLPQLAAMSYFHYAVIYGLLYYVVIYCLPPMQGKLPLILWVICAPTRFRLAWVQQGYSFHFSSK